METRVQPEILILCHGSAWNLDYVEVELALEIAVGFARVGAQRIVKHQIKDSTILPDTGEKTDLPVSAARPLASAAAAAAGTFSLFFVYIAVLLISYSTFSSSKPELFVTVIRTRCEWLTR